MAVYVVARLTTIVFAAILARLLTPEDFGLVAAATVALSFLNLGSRFGVSTALIQAPVLNDAMVRTAKTMVLIAAVTVFAAGQVFAPAIAAWFRHPDLTDVLRVTFFCLLINAISVVPQGLMTRDLRARDLALIDFAAACVGALIISIPMALAGFGYWSLVAGSLGSALTRGAIMRLAVKLPPGMSLDAFSLQRLWVQGGGFTLAGLLTRFCSEADKLIVGRYLGPAQLGFYSRANSVAGIPAFLYDLVIDRAAMPAFAAVQDDPARLKRAYERAVSLIALVGIPLAVLIAAMAPDIVRFVLGPGWGATIVPLRVLSLVLYVRFAGKPSTTVLTGTGKPYVISGIQTIFLVTVVGGCMVSWRFGVVGVAWAVAIATGLDYGLMTWAACQRAGLSVRAFIRAHRAGLANGILVAAVLVPTVLSAHRAGIPSLITLLLAGGVAGVACCIGAATAPRIFLGTAGRELAEQALHVLSNLRRGNHS